MSAKEQKKPASPSYAKLVKGYMGFLTGTGKSASTISSYQGDLSLFEDFLHDRKKDFYKVVPKDFEAYQVWLEKQGLRINTRRRKILSAKALVKYAVSRKKLKASDVIYVKAPDRLERLPWIPLPADWEKICASLSAKTPLGLRNALVVRLLGEMGMTVAELTGLRWENWSGGDLSLDGKRERKLQVSPEVRALLGDWREKNAGKHLFPGFNRHGPTSERMSSRGVELYFRHLAKNTGLKLLKPKTLRHYAIVSWLAENVAESEIQRRLGVHSAYSFEAYRKHLETRG